MGCLPGAVTSAVRRAIRLGWFGSEKTTTAPNRRQVHLPRSPCTACRSSRDEPIFRSVRTKQWRLSGRCLRAHPSAPPQMLQSLGALQSRWRQIVVAGELPPRTPRTPRGGAPRAADLYDRATRGQRRRRQTSRRAPRRSLPDDCARGARHRFYVCQNFSVQAPVFEPRELEALLKKPSSLASGLSLR